MKIQRDGLFNENILLESSSTNQPLTHPMGCINFNTENKFYKIISNNFLKNFIFKDIKKINRMGHKFLLEKFSGNGVEQ